MTDSLDLQLDSFERRIRELERELAELRQSAAVARSSIATVETGAAPPSPPVVSPTPSPVAAPRPTPPRPIEEPQLTSPRLDEQLERARSLVAAGRLKDALKTLEAARGKAVWNRDVSGLGAILGLTESIGEGATGAVRSRAGRQAYATAQNMRFLERKLGLRTPAAHAVPAARPVPTTARRHTPTTAPAPTPPPREPRFKLPEIAAADLLGARALAVAGGVVTLLGIVFFFVLAVNRGWIGPVGRVALGGTASAFLFAAGFELRRRYKDTHSSLAAVGVGIAGGFVTLLAAAALYHLLPDYAALVVCATIAAVALATALAWRSQMVAGFGLIGAMLVPVAVVVQSGLTVLGTAFVAVVFAATAILSVRYRWRELLMAGSAVSLPQIAVLVAQAEYHGQAPWRIVVLVAVFSLLYLGTGIAYQLRIEGEGLQQISTSFVTTAGLLAAASAVRLYGSIAQEGIAVLAITLAYALLSWLVARRSSRDARDLSAYLAAISLTLAAIALADLLSGQPLAYAWAAEAAALAWLARRVRELRYQVWSAIYLVLALGHVLILDAPPTHLLVANSHPAAGAGTAVGLALALVVFGRYAKPRAERFADRGGLYGLLVPFFTALENAQGILRSVTLWASGVLGAYAASLGTLSLFSSFDWGHVAAAALWSLLGLGIVTAGLCLDVSELRVGGLAWLATSAVVVVVHGNQSVAATPRSWSYLTVAVVLVAAALAYQLLQRRADLSSMDICAGLAAAGVGLGAIASAGILSGQPLAYVWAAEAAMLAWLARRTNALHFQALSIGTLGLAVAHVLTLDAPPSHFVTRTAHPAAGIVTAVAVALAAAAIAYETRTAKDEGSARYAALADLEGWLAHSQTPLRRAELWLAGAMASYAASLGTLALFASFDWGHVAVAGLSSTLGLAIVLVGLRRGTAHVSTGGVIWLAATTVTVVAHGEIELAPPPRAWSFVILAAALLTAGHTYELRQRTITTLELVPGVLVVVSLALSLAAIVPLLRNTGGAIDPEGAALLGLAALYAGLTALVFRRAGQRDYRTLLWAIALSVGAVAANRLVDGTFLVLAWAGSGAIVSWLSARTREMRLQVGAGALCALALGHAIIVQSPPSHLFSVRVHPGSGAPAVLLVAVAIAVFGYHLTRDDGPWRQAQLYVWSIAGMLAVYGLSLGILDLVQRAFPQASLHTSFQRGHTAVSAFWGLLGLALLYAGLKRWRGLRVAGFAVLGVSLAKIFVYDLPSLSSVTRALSFLAVGAMLLLGGFLYQRLSASEEPRRRATRGSA